MFLNAQKYDFSRVGRLKFNIKLDLSTPLSEKILRLEDIARWSSTCSAASAAHRLVDDIDHLGNRRVRAVGELLENQFRIGLVRMERAIQEKMSVYQEMATAMPHDLINAKPVMAAIREFFGSQPALPVHGPDQPAVRDHPQAPALGPGAGRPVARARRVRGARRAPHPLRPHLPDRDAGRPEHRPDLLACPPTPASTSTASSRAPTARSRAGACSTTYQVLDPGETELQGRRHRRAAPSCRRPTRPCWPARRRPAEVRALLLLPVGLGGGQVHHRPGQRPSWTRAATSSTERVSARKAGNFVLAPREEIEYMDV